MSEHLKQNLLQTVKCVRIIIKVHLDSEQQPVWPTLKRKLLKTFGFLFCLTSPEKFCFVF